MKRQLQPVLLLTLLLCLRAGAAILPDTIGDWIKGPATEPVITDAPLWREFGLQASEIAPYTAHGQKYTISAWRFSDATGSFSALQMIRPAVTFRLEMAGIGLSAGADELVAVGNYLFVFKGYKPKPEELNHVIGTAPRYAQSPLPSLPKYLPAGVVPGSERYIIGPEALSRFAPAVPPSAAAFHFSPEASFAKYKTKRGETALLLFSYPTMEIARDRLAAFQQIPGMVVKRSGPLVALTLNATNPDDAERILSQVRFQAEITVPEHVPTLKDNPANLFLNIIILCGILICFCLVSGLVVGVLRLTIRRGGSSGDGESMISLNLTGRH